MDREQLNQKLKAWERNPKTWIVIVLLLVAAAGFLVLGKQSAAQAKALDLKTQKYGIEYSNLSLELQKLRSSGPTPPVLSSPQQWLSQAKSLMSQDWEITVSRDEKKNIVGHRISLLWRGNHPLTIEDLDTLGKLRPAPLVHRARLDESQQSIQLLMLARKS